MSELSPNEIIRYIKKAIRWHQISFMFVALPAWSSGMNNVLYEWFEMAYQCVRNYNAPDRELKIAYKIFKEILDYHKNMTAWDLAYWVDYGIQT